MNHIDEEEIHFICKELNVSTTNSRVIIPRLRLTSGRAFKKIGFELDNVRELDSAEIKKIAYYCRKATYLIEKKTVRERLELKIHLAGCSVCKTFEQQSMVINRMVKELLDKTYFGFSLEEGYKIFLHEKIEKKSI